MMPLNRIKKSTGKKIRIRMYRLGIGDCFLLTFYNDKQKSHILIDCGILTGTPGGQQKIQQVAENIAKETGNHLHAVVATHEHWDHISGFDDIFKNKIEMDEIWLAWTEDPNDYQARELKRQKQLQLQTLHMALMQMQAVKDSQIEKYGKEFSALLGFFGAEKGTSMLDFSEKTARVMEMLSLREKPAPIFWRPGNLIQRNWLPKIRVYVLGPPTEIKMLKKRGQIGRDTYGLIGSEKTFSAALEKILADRKDYPYATKKTAAAKEDTPDRNLANRIYSALPFHPSLQWRMDFLTERVSKIEGSSDLEKQCVEIYQKYMTEGEKSRRIDHDWLLSAVRLGLQLDNATNNTSLVLAFELIDTGQVLLFPGDAQIGSWKSWTELSWKVHADVIQDKNSRRRKFKKVATADLLQRTIFYKVGHHGSHNATLREGGLENMTSPQLVAVIPVNEAFAQKKHWKMPAPALLERLEEQTEGRIYRSDTPAWPPVSKFKDASLDEWNKFILSVELDPSKEKLFVDYFI